ncbi:cellulose biosynthesis protein BcsD [Muricoccus radiodurans]|uniref:cellulose biosynthesis protein BcsD n=1 Tax=Muricoccus radiodurans TaxID=2231721 RepID=UPI003CEEED33
MSDLHDNASVPAGSGPDWSGFLRALLEILEAHLEAEERAVLLRAIGARLAATSPLPPEDTLAGLEARMNERLAITRWGSVSIALDSTGPSLVLTHATPPSIPVAKGVEDHPLGPVLAGLHAGWIAAQPGAEPDIEASLVSAAEDRVVLRYGV